MGRPWRLDTGRTFAAMSLYPIIVYLFNFGRLIAIGDYRGGPSPSGARADRDGALVIAMLEASWICRTLHGFEAGKHPSSQYVSNCSN